VPAVAAASAGHRRETEIQLRVRVTGRSHGDRDFVTVARRRHAGLKNLKKESELSRIRGTGGGMCPGPGDADWQLELDSNLKPPVTVNVP
jgi:hypothetical protein